jgi:succinate dehydrogenase / fumarate reductase cytochrome b subunit
MTKRPLSPHLGIYRWQITMTLSILHRITGCALVAGTVLLVAWLWSAAYAPGFYPQLHSFVMSGIGQIMILGWIVAFYFHLGNGIRHLFWDIGKGFEIHTAARSGWTVVIFTLVMTFLTLGTILGRSDNACLSEHPPAICESAK